MNENMLKALQAIGRDEKADGRSVVALKKRGLITEDGKLTLDGREAFLDSVETEIMHTIILGTPLSGVKNNAGKKGTLQKGTELIVVYAGRTKDRYKQRWADCFLSKDFPLIRVLNNRAHRFRQQRVPKSV